MTDHEKLMVALMGSDDSTPKGAVTTGDVVRMLHALGADRRKERDDVALSARLVA